MNSQHADKRFPEVSLWSRVCEFSCVVMFVFEGLQACAFVRVCVLARTRVCVCLCVCVCVIAHAHLCVIPFVRTCLFVFVLARACWYVSHSAGVCAHL